MGLLPRVVIASPRPEDLSARRLRDAALVERIGAVHRDNYGVYGVRKCGMRFTVKELILVVNTLPG